MSKTPQAVVDAIKVVAAHLRVNDYAECIVSRRGGAAFHKTHKVSEVLDMWEKDSNKLRAEIERMRAVVKAATAYNDGIGSIVGEAERLAALFDAVDALRALEAQP